LSIFGTTIFSTIQTEYCDHEVYYSVRHFSIFGIAEMREFRPLFSKFHVCTIMNIQSIRKQSKSDIHFKPLFQARKGRGDNLPCASNAIFCNITELKNCFIIYLFIFKILES
jgi:hypothetical protein